MYRKCACATAAGKEDAGEEKEIVHNLPRLTKSIQQSLETRTVEGPKATSELIIYIKLLGDLGMSDKAKKQVVSTHDQCLAHHIFLEICLPKSLVVWLVTTANHLATACMQDLEAYIHIRRACGMVS